MKKIKPVNSTRQYSIPLKKIKKSKNFWGILGVLLTIAGIIITIYFSKKPVYSPNKNEISVSSRVRKLKIVFLTKKITNNDHEQFSLKYLVSGFDSSGIPLDDIKVNISLKSEFSEKFEQNLKYLNDLGIENPEISNVITLSIANPNYNGIIDCIPKKPGKFILKIEAISKNNNIKDSATIEIIVLPKLFFAHNSIVDVKPFNIFSLTEYNVCLLSEEFFQINKENFDWDLFFLKITSDYLGVIGGAFLKLESKPNDTSILLEHNSSIVTIGCKLWKLSILNKHQLKIIPIKYTSKIEFIKFIKIPENTVQRVLIYSDTMSDKNVNIYTSLGATGRAASVTVILGNTIYSTIIPLYENFMSGYSHFPLFFFLDESELKIQTEKKYLIIDFDKNTHGILIKKIQIKV